MWRIEDKGPYRLAVTCHLLQERNSRRDCLMVDRGGNAAPAGRGTLRQVLSCLPAVSPSGRLTVITPSVNILLSQYRLAKEIHVPARRISEIVLEKRGISADTALRLGLYFGTTALLWINLQARYDLEVASDAIMDRLKAEIKPLRSAA